MGAPRLFILEDEFLLASELAREFRAAGFDIAGMASTIDAAIPLVRDGTFDVAILDMNIRGRPVYEVVRLLVGRAVRLVFVTGYARPNIPAWVPPSLRFEKPVSAATILAALRQEGFGAAAPAPQAVAPRIALDIGDRLLLEGLRHLLSEAGLSVLPGRARLSAFRQAGAEPPDILILGEREAAADLGPAIADIRRRKARARFVMLVEDLDVAALRRAIDAGVTGYLMKSISPYALKQSLQLVLAGEMVLPPELLAHVPLASDPAPPFAVPDVGLSEREVQILAGMVGGLSNKVIGNRLRITEGSVKSHVKAILRKIHAQNRTQGAIWAIAHGISAEQIDSTPRLL